MRKTSHMTSTDGAHLAREREVLERISTPESEGNVCGYCEKPIAEGWFHWLEDDGQPHRMDPMYGGEIESYPSWRHADGSPGHGDLSTVYPKYRCPGCKAFDTVNVRDTGYGSDCHCTACGWHKYFDRGD